MRILRQEVGRTRVNIGEVAAATAGDANLLADGFAMIKQRDFAPALTSTRRAEQTGSASADDDCVEVLGHSILQVGLAKRNPSKAAHEL